MFQDESDMDTQVADNAGIEPRAAPVLNVDLGTSTVLQANPTAAADWSTGHYHATLPPGYPTIGTVPQGHNPAVGTNKEAT